MPFGTFTLVEENDLTSSTVYLIPDERAMVEGIDRQEFPQSRDMPKGSRLAVAVAGSGIIRAYELDEDFHVLYDPTNEFYLVGEDSMIFGLGPEPVVMESEDDRIEVEIRL